MQPYFMYTLCKIRLYTSAPIEDTQRRYAISMDRIHSKYSYSVASVFLYPSYVVHKI